MSRDLLMSLRGVRIPQGLGIPYETLRMYILENLEYKQKYLELLD